MRMASCHFFGVLCQVNPIRKRSSLASAFNGMYSGDAGSIIIFRPLEKMEGSAIGRVSAGVSQPALPHEAPEATPPRSTTVTLTPSSCRYQAVDRPTNPAPTMTTCSGVVTLAMVHTPFKIFPTLGLNFGAECGAKQRDFVFHR